MTPKKIVLLTEGHGEEVAAPILINRLLAERNAHQELIFVDDDPFRIGNLPKIAKDDFKIFRNKLKQAAMRPGAKGCMLILDGDCDMDSKTPFCAKLLAHRIAEIAAEEGAGRQFSTTIVFAKMEFESWLLAGSNSLAGKPLLDGGKAFRKDFVVPSGDLEVAPRNAKGAFKDALSGSYKPTTDQASVTRMVDLQQIRDRKMRSFMRLEHAVDQLISAFREDRHIVTPVTNV